MPGPIPRAAAASLLAFLFIGPVSMPAVGAAPAACSRGQNPWVSTWQFDSKAFGNYIINNNNWGGTPGQQTWANNASCWGVTTEATKEQGNIRSYPSVTRGWTQNGGMLDGLSSAGSQDWTLKSGMGLRVDALKRSKIHWAFTAPTNAGSRWLGLIDVYFHRAAAPAAREFPPQVDLMIDQALMDLPLPGGSDTYYAAVARRSNASQVTLGGNTYLIYIDAPGEQNYHQPGGTYDPPVPPADCPYGQNRRALGFA